MARRPMRNEEIPSTLHAVAQCESLTLVTERSDHCGERGFFPKKMPRALSSCQQACETNVAGNDCNAAFATVLNRAASPSSSANVDDQFPGR